MRNYVINASNSAIYSAIAAFISGIANSTLTVNSNGELISFGGGDGADVTDFVRVVVDGEIVGSGTNDNGLKASLNSTTDALSLTVGASGVISGNVDGINSSQAEAIGNSGSIQGDLHAGIEEDFTTSAANTLANAAGGQIIGQDYGLYEQGNGKGVTQSVTNSGVILAQVDAAIYLYENRADQFTNLAGASIVGSLGVDDANSTGEQKLFNAGLIEGHNDDAIEFYGAVGSIALTNAASGRVDGDFGVLDQYSHASLNIVNAGMIDGGADDGIFVFQYDDSVGPRVSNAANAGISGDEYGVAFNTVSGSASISNAGSIWGKTDDGILFYGDGVVTVVNAANAVIRGAIDGIGENIGSGAAKITNAGLIAGGSDSGISLSSNSGSTRVTNAVAGAITGDVGIIDESSAARTIVNAGEIVGTAGAGIYELSNGGFTFLNAATGRVFGAGTLTGYGLEDTDSGVQTITNYGLIHGESDGIFEYGNGNRTIYNMAGGRIVGEGASWDGIQDNDLSGAQTIANAGTITGATDAVAMNGESDADVFENSGIVNGSVFVNGAATVKIFGGVVRGDINMGNFSSTDHFTITGGVVTGAVQFSNGADNVATIGADVAGLVLQGGSQAMTFAYKAATSSQGNSTNTQDVIVNWNTGDVIDLSAFAGKSSFAAISQDTHTGDDLVSLNGSKFSLALRGVTTQLTASNFNF